MHEKARAICEYLEEKCGWDVLRDDTVQCWVCNSCGKSRSTNYCPTCGNKGPGPKEDSGVVEMEQALRFVFGENDGK